MDTGTTGIGRLREAMEKAVGELREWPERVVRVFHHNDSDGLSSGAILTRAFERAGFEVRRCSLEKPYPRVLERVFAGRRQIVVFADFAGRIAPLISGLNRGRNLTLILDHHVAEASTDPRVHNLDGDLYGVEGDRDISASTTCYLFARALDDGNRDLAHVAVIGAIGDGFLVDGRLAGENRKALLEAADQGTVEIREGRDGEDYVLRAGGAGMPFGRLNAILDALGGAGYYRGGPEAGVRACLDGVGPEAGRLAGELEALKARAFRAETERLRGGGLAAAGPIQWFSVGDRFSPMGVKMIGAFCEDVAAMDLAAPDSYLAGFQALPDEIPGFGPIRFDAVKVSMRVPPPLDRRIRENRAMSLDVLLPAATDRLGGFSDACHRVCAATTIPAGRERALIEEMERILAGDRGSA